MNEWVLNRISKVYDSIDLSRSVSSRPCVKLVIFLTINQNYAHLQRPKQCEIVLFADGTIINTYCWNTIKFSLGLRQQFMRNFVMSDVKTAIIGSGFLPHFKLSLNILQRILTEEDSLIKHQESLLYSTPQVLMRHWYKITLQIDFTSIS